ncbi:MAG: hypothetical protein AB1454_00665 [Candidatus Auribacterota bacterium]
MDQLNNGKHFVYDIQKVLVIRSYSPSMETAFKLIREEYEHAQVDILRVKNSVPHPCESYPEIHNIYETQDASGFTLARLGDHYRAFRNKEYDAVFILYGVQNGMARYFNVDLYAYWLNSRYKLTVDPDGFLSVLKPNRFYKKAVEYVFSYAIFGINLFFTFLLIAYTAFLMVLLSPFALIFRYFRR